MKIGKSTQGIYEVVLKINQNQYGSIKFNLGLPY
jgi:hypothetical protein